MRAAASIRCLHLLWQRLGVISGIVHRFVTAVVDDVSMASSITNHVQLLMHITDVESSTSSDVNVGRSTACKIG